MRKEVDNVEFRCPYQKAGEIWKRFQDSCLVAPTVNFAECSEADASEVTKETVSGTSILKKMRKTQ